MTLHPDILTSDIVERTLYSAHLSVAIGFAPHSCPMITIKRYLNVITLGSGLFPNYYNLFYIVQFPQVHLKILLVFILANHRVSILPSNAYLAGLYNSEEEAFHGWLSAMFIGVFLT